MQAHARALAPQGVASCSRVGAAAAAATTTASSVFLRLPPAREREKGMRRRRAAATAAGGGAGPSGKSGLVASLARCMQSKSNWHPSAQTARLSILEQSWFGLPRGGKRKGHVMADFHALSLSLFFSPPSPPLSALPTLLKTGPSDSQQQQPPVPPLRPPLKKASGLSRTPAGGLAAGGALTSTDLPPPAVAVRNLIELAQYAHLASNMSQMHHR